MYRFVNDIQDTDTSDSIYLTFIYNKQGVTICTDKDIKPESYLFPQATSKEAMLVSEI